MNDYSVLLPPDLLSVKTHAVVFHGLKASIWVEYQRFSSIGLAYLANARDTAINDVLSAWDSKYQQRRLVT